MRLVMLVVIAGCWRGAPAPATDTHDPVSFVVRVHGLADLKDSTAALEPKLAATTQRILGLADEAQRGALRDELHALSDNVERLALRSRVARTRGDDPAALDQVDRALGDARASLAKLRHGLSYANTLEHLQAYQPAEPAVWHHVGVADFNAP